MSTTGKEDCEELLGALVPIAEQLLQEHGEFFPFGASMELDGEITREATSDGTEQPTPQALIDLLNEAHRANRADLLACGVAFDTQVARPDRPGTQDAIAVALDHVSGYSVVVVFPYGFSAEGSLLMESPVTLKGAGAIFDAALK